MTPAITVYQVSRIFPEVFIHCLFFFKKLKLKYKSALQNTWQNINSVNSCYEMCGKIPAVGLSQLKPFPLTNEGLTCKLYSPPKFPSRVTSSGKLLSPIFYIKIELMSCASPDELAEVLQLQGDLTPANINAKAWLQSCQTHI